MLHELYKPPLDEIDAIGPSHPRIDDHIEAAERLLEG
jgi:hypothetical protein